MSRQTDDIRRRMLEHSVGVCVGQQAQIVVACARNDMREYDFQIVLNFIRTNEWPGEFTVHGDRHAVVHSGGGGIRFLIPGGHNTGLRCTHVLGTQLVDMEWFGRPFIPRDWGLEKPYE